MARLRHVQQRAARLAATDFPALPTLAAGAASDGVALLLQPADPDPDLGVWRELIDGLWRGPLGPSAGEPHVLVASFVRPAVVPERPGETLLRLVARRDGVLASFIQAHDDDTARPLGRRGAAPARLEIWWQGRRRAVALGALRRIPLSALWSPPRLTFHPSIAPQTRAIVEGVGSDTATADEAAVRIGRSALQLSRPADALGEVEAGLARLKPLTLLGLRAALASAAAAGGIGGWLRGLLGARPAAPTARPGAGPPRARPATRAGGAPRGPGLLQRLRGWLVWNTPLARQQQAAHEARRKLVEQLIAAGDIDRALKLALSLGGGDRPDRPLPLSTRLPEARGSLDFILRPALVMTPMLTGAWMDLRGRYHELARRLAADGDHRRAAYIHAQLLGNVPEAVNVLEAGGLFAEAAKLAMDAKLPARRIIGLLFKAGELDPALTLAKQAACFDQLADDSRGDARYHAFVIQAWTEALVATGQWLRALQVTDRLAADAALSAPLAPARRRWLAAALSAEGPDAVGAEARARGLLMAPWGEAPLAGLALEDFPYAPIADGDDPFAGNLAGLQRALRSHGGDPQGRLLELAGALAWLGDPKRSDQAGFWRGPASAVLEPFVRRVFEVSADRLASSELDTLRGLLDEAGLGVLAADVGKLRTLHAPPRGERNWTAPPASGSAPAIARACVLANGQMVIWRESDLLQLLDRQGAVLWQGPMAAVAALVPVGAGGNVIVVQRTPNDLPTLSRFAAHEQRIHPIGRVPLVGHHDLTSESQWLVQIGGEVGALDLARLCAAEPEVVFLWSVQITERLRAFSFLQSPQAAAWATHDVSRERFGVIETWSLKDGKTLTTEICLPPALPAGGGPRTTRWRWSPGGFSGAITAAEGTKVVMPQRTWSEDGERSAVLQAHALAAAQVAPLESLQACDFGRPYLQSVPRTDVDGRSGVAICSASTTGAPILVLRSDPQHPLTCLARAPARESDRGAPAGKTAIGVCLFADDLGRLFIVQPETGVITTV